MVEVLFAGRWYAYFNQDRVPIWIFISTGYIVTVLEPDGSASVVRILWGTVKERWLEVKEMNEPFSSKFQVWLVVAAIPRECVHPQRSTYRLPITVWKLAVLRWESTARGIHLQTHDVYQRTRNVLRMPWNSKYKIQNSENHYRSMLHLLLLPLESDQSPLNMPDLQLR